MNKIIARIKKLFWVSRPISWVNTAFPFGAGYIMTQHHIDLTFIVGVIFFLIPYNLCMYGVNDVFDYESDIRNPRKGGIEGAKIAKKDHRFVLQAVAVTTVPFVIFLLTRSSLLSAVTLLFVMADVLAYSAPVLRFKERPFLDSISSSIHFVGPLVYALSFTTFHRSYVPIIVAFFLWGMASHAFGAVQDIIADKEAGIGSVATVIGARNTVWFSLILYIASGALIATLGTAGIICSLVAIPYALNVSEFWNITEAKAASANRGWKRFIPLNFFAGFVVTIVLIAVYRHVF